MAEAHIIYVRLAVGIGYPRRVRLVDYAKVDVAMPKEAERWHPLLDRLSKHD